MCTVMLLFFYDESVPILLVLVTHSFIFTVTYYLNLHVVYHFSHQKKTVEYVPMFKLIFAGEGAELYASVHQPDKRRIHAPQYFDIGVTILKEGTNGTYNFIASTGNAVDRQHQLEVGKGLLTAGTYILIPTSTGCKIENERRCYLAKRSDKNTKINSSSNSNNDCGHTRDNNNDDGNMLNDNTITTRDAVVTIHCDKLFSVQQTEFSRDAYDLAIKKPAIHGGHQTDLFGDGSVILYTLKSGYNGNTYVAENKKVDMYVKLDMDFSKSKNVVTHDSRFSVTNIIGPCQSVVMKHLMPASDGEPWQAGWQVAGAWVNKDEFERQSQKMMKMKRKEDVNSCGAPTAATCNGK